MMVCGATGETGEMGETRQDEVNMLPDESRGKTIGDNLQLIVISPEKVLQRTQFILVV